MKPEVKEFILEELQNAYSAAADNLARARMQQARTPEYDLAIIDRYRQRTAIAKEALAYFGVYR